jgi:hypothetical protein
MQTILSRRDQTHVFLHVQDYGAGTSLTHVAVLGRAGTQAEHAMGSPNIADESEGSSLRYNGESRSILNDSALVWGKWRASLSISLALPSCELSGRPP